ncbi:MAG: hypothetical protein ACTIJ6_05425 [Leucobacter sp.]
MDTVSSTPKARKRHWCEVCGWAIEPGETYERVITFDGGDVLTWKAHQSPCSIAASRATNADYCDWQSGMGADSDDVALWAEECAPVTDEIAAEMRRRYEINNERHMVKVKAMLAGKEKNDD